MNQNNKLMTKKINKKNGTNKFGVSKIKNTPSMHSWLLALQLVGGAWLSPITAVAVAAAVAADAAAASMELIREQPPKPPQCRTPCRRCDVS